MSSGKKASKSSEKNRVSKIKTITINIEGINIDIFAKILKKTADVITIAKNPFLEYVIIVANTVVVDINKKNIFLKLNLLIDRIPAKQNGKIKLNQVAA
tara:strand:- start:104 stop:400 length:297 start_codon:yes stop_codon:yes gene_type:complete